MKVDYEMLYLSREISLQEYILKSNDSRVLSNRLSKRVAQILNQGGGVPSAEDEGLKTARQSVSTVISWVLSQYPRAEILEASQYTYLDKEWKADILVFTSGQLGIPIQVKSCRSELHRYKTYAKKAGGLPVREACSLLGVDREFYVEPAIVVHTGGGKLAVERSKRRLLYEVSAELSKLNTRVAC